MGLGNENVGDVHHGEGNAGAESNNEVLLEEGKHEECTSGKEDTGVSDLVTSSVSLNSVNEGSEVVSHEITFEHLLGGLLGEDEGSEADDSDEAAEGLASSVDSNELGLGDLVLVEASEGHHTELDEGSKDSSDHKVEHNSLLDEGNDLLDALVA